MKKPKEIYVCRHSKDNNENPIKDKCYWYYDKWIGVKKDCCSIDEKKCDQVTYVRKDEKK